MLPPKYRPSIGVNISEIGRKVAQEMYDAGERAARAKRDAALQHDYERREEWYVIARRIRAGRYVAETVEHVLNMGPLKAYGPTAEWATKQLHWEFACGLHRLKVGFDPEKGDWKDQRAKHFEESKERAAKATFKLVETLGEK